MHATRLLTTTALSLVFAGAAMAGEPEQFPESWFWGDADQRGVQDAMIGKEPPPLLVSGWIGEEKELEDLKGKVVLIDFWATWCGPCLSAVPKVNKMIEKYEDDGLEVIGVCVSSRGQEKMAETVAEHDFQYPTAKDPTRKTEEAWNVEWYPTYALIDRAGNVRAVGLQTGKVEDAVKALLEEPAPEEATSEDSAEDS